MQVNELWDQIGWPEVQILNQESRVNTEDPLKPLTKETVYFRSFLQKYNPTWSLSKVQINRFTDTWNVMMPFAISDVESDFVHF